MRNYNRFIINQEIVCEIADRKINVILYDLSCGGCMIEASSSDVAVGEDCSIFLRGFGCFPGQIVWRISKNIGIKFTYPLHQKVIESFGMAGEEHAFDEDDPRDRFGLPIFG